MTKINELNTGQGNVDVEGVIKEVGEPRTFNKFGRELTVVNAILEDGSGNIKLTLWNEDVRRFKEGDVVKVVNGYVNEFQGEKQLTSGKFGKIEKAGEVEEQEKPAKLDGDTAEEVLEEPAVEESEESEESEEEEAEEDHLLEKDGDKKDSEEEEEGEEKEEKGDKKDTDKLFEKNLDQKEEKEEESKEKKEE